MKRLEEQVRKAKCEAAAARPVRRRDWVEWIAIGLALIVVAWLKS